MELRQCNPSDLQAVIELNETIYAALPDKSVLRHNSPEMIASCLEEPNVTLGIWDDNLLVAIGMLYVPQCLEEDHFHDLGLQGEKTISTTLVCKATTNRRTKNCFSCATVIVAWVCNANSFARSKKSPWREATTYFAPRLHPITISVSTIS